jgi:hypothetical protein
VPSIGRYFNSDAVAGGDQATAEVDPGLREQPRMSGDGRWWWNGERWLATATPDGLWQWDGREWRPTIELRGVRPGDLATTLALLAEDRYARAARLLVERAREWRPQGELRDLVQRAAAMRGRVQHTLAPDGSGLLRRVRGRPQQRQQAEEEHALLDTRYRALLVQIGRLAPRPSVKEADDMLEVARLLDRRAAGITEALAAAHEAERHRAQAIEAARQDLWAAEVACREAAEAAARERERVEAGRRDARAAARARVRAAMEPAAGEILAEAGTLRVHRTFVATPAGHLAVDGASAWTGSAVALWRDHRDLLQDAVLLETPETDDFLSCLSERRRDQFLLLSARSRTLLWHCPPGEEKPLRRLVTAVNRQSSAAAATAAERLDAAAAVVADCQRPPEQGPAAEDGRLAAAVEEARQRLEEARREPKALLVARELAAAETGAVATPPAPLG